MEKSYCQQPGALCTLILCATLALFGSEFISAQENNVPYKFPSGDVYTGTWKDGKPSGQGTMVFSDGRKYVGEFKNDLPDGQGTLYNDKGEEFYTGKWKEGKRVN